VGERAFFRCHALGDRQWYWVGGCLGCGKGGCEEGGKAGWAEVIKLIFYIFSPLLKVVMLFIQAPVMCSYTL